MTTMRGLVAAGFLALAVAACGGSAPADETEADRPVAAETAVDDEVAANEPEGAGAIIYDEEVPVPGTTLGACELITPDDVGLAFGATSPIAEGVFEASPTVLSPGRSECRYEGAFGRLIVEVTPEDGANLYDAAYGAYDGLEPITGLGDGAFWSDKNHRGFVWQDRVTTMFTIFPSDSSLTGVQLTEILGEAMIAKL
jgi:hypothetical protein